MSRGRKSLNLVQRLTLWYAGVFALCCAVAMGVFFFLMQDVTTDWADQELTESVEEFRSAFDPAHPEGIISKLTNEERDEQGAFFGRVGNVKGKFLVNAVSGDLQKVPFRPELIDDLPPGKTASVTVKLGRDRAARTVYTRLADGWILQLGLRISGAGRWMEEFFFNLVKMAGLAVLLGLAGGALVAYRGLAPVVRMARRVSDIDGRSLNVRLPVSGSGDEIDRLTLAFNQMLRRIDTLVQGLREVTDSVAHDLRTPLAGIRGMAEVVLRNPREPSEYQRVLYQIMDKLDSLLGVFNSMLDVAEAEGGALAIKREAVDLRELLDEVIETFAPVAESFGIRLQLEAASGLGLTGDSRRLFQALSNLLDNAVKYTGPGGEIHLQGGPDPDGHGLVITVADSGCGIAEDDLPHIFERYYRGRTARYRRGSGLGLPLVRAIVQAHGGRIMVTSKPGRGTSFRLFLPAAPANAVPTTMNSVNE